MKSLVRNSIGVAFFALLAANIYIFLNGIHLADQVTYYEHEVTKLRQENVNLEKHVYKFESITYAASIAAELDYVEAKDPMYLTEPGYALNR